MLELHRGREPLFIPPAEEAPLQHGYIRLADSPEPAGFSSECSNHRGAFKTKIHLLSLLPSVCVCVFQVALPRPLQLSVSHQKMPY